MVMVVNHPRHKKINTSFTFFLLWQEFSQGKTSKMFIMPEIFTLQIYKVTITKSAGVLMTQISTPGLILSFRKKS